MTAEAAAMTRTWRVGRWKVTATVPQIRAGQVASAAIEWHPDMPRKLSPANGVSTKQGAMPPSPSYLHSSAFEARCWRYDAAEDTGAKTMTDQLYDRRRSRATGGGESPRGARR